MSYKVIYKDSINQINRYRIKQSKELILFIKINSIIVYILEFLGKRLNSKIKIFLGIIAWLATYSMIANFIIYPVPQIINFIFVLPLIFLFTGFMLALFDDTPSSSPSQSKVLFNIFFPTLVVLLSLILGITLFYIF
jgi:hypothetical protein